jgi:hypothetical protein
MLAELEIQKEVGATQQACSLLKKGAPISSLIVEVLTGVPEACVTQRGKRQILPVRVYPIKSFI